MAGLRWFGHVESKDDGVRVKQDQNWGAPQNCHLQFLGLKFTNLVNLGPRRQFCGASEHSSGAFQSCLTLTKFSLVPWSVAVLSSNCGADLVTVPPDHMEFLGPDFFTLITGVKQYMLKNCWWTLMDWTEGMPNKNLIVLSLLCQRSFEELWPLLWECQNVQFLNMLKSACFMCW